MLNLNVKITNENRHDQASKMNSEKISIRFQFYLVVKKLFRKKELTRKASFIHSFNRYLYTKLQRKKRN